jgi:3-mercaptopyruvate sulfurtransferase SseA
MQSSVLISAQALSDLLEANHDDVHVLDATFPDANNPPLANFEKNHIKGAQFLDIKAIARFE